VEGLDLDGGKVHDLGSVAVVVFEGFVFSRIGFFARYAAGAVAAVPDEGGGFGEGSVSGGVGGGSSLAGGGGLGGAVGGFLFFIFEVLGVEEWHGAILCAL